MTFCLHPVFSVTPHKLLQRHCQRTIFAGASAALLSDPTKTRILTVSVSCWTCSRPIGSSTQAHAPSPRYIDTTANHW